VLQYSDYAVWQRDYLKVEQLETQLSYWRETLDGAPPLLDLPADRGRAAVLSYRGEVLRFNLGVELTCGMKALARRNGASLFMALLAVYAILLRRLTGQEDLVIGSPIANRNRKEIEPVIGFFVNMLPLRLKLDGDPSFEDLLGRVRQLALDAYAHQDLPFEKLVEDLQPERNLSHTPIFQTVFALQNAPLPPLELAGLTIRPWETEGMTAKFDLQLTLQEEGEQLTGQFEYSSDLFERGTIRCMLRYLTTLLEGVLADPTRPISEIPILTEAERQLLLAPPQAEYPRDIPVHVQFEVQAERVPEAIALVLGEERLTYAELNQRANRLAHLLKSHGVGPEVLVGICLERSVEMVVGILAILKAGGAYLPLDPGYPGERLVYLIKDSGTPLLITQRPLLAEFETEGVTQLFLDELDEVLSGLSQENIPCECAPEHLAYVIYTSGSTGNPKGVQVEHGNLSRLFSATDPWYHFKADDVWTLFHSFAFDFSVWELWGALIHGGRLVLVPYLVSRSPADFYDLLVREGVTVLNQTPSAFRQLMQEEESREEFGELALRYVIFGGEALEVASLRPWFERHGDSEPQLVNMYGITETTVHVTYRPLTAEDVVRGSVIGVPISDLELYLLDQYRQPVPVGVAGELYVGGAGVARGYLKRPELTSERFLENPFTGKGRLYRTGDLARRLDDGELEYLGRADHQVKIRGFRIEPGEIEAAVLCYPGVREAVVLPWEYQDGKRLVAYLVWDSSNQQSKDALEVFQNQHVNQWQSLYQETYKKGREDLEMDFNIIGWNSSYTQEPIPEEEMREWTDQTVAWILATVPEQVLEIGCGSGLLLSRIAPSCTSYLATDFSQHALDHVQRMQMEFPWLERVRLLNRKADDFSDIKAGSFDTVIINSVVQYFPSLDYLVQVIEGALQALKPGGRLLLGDLRSLPLLESYHASVQLYQASGELTVAELAGRVRRSLEKEEELVLHPALFLALKERIPRISAVSMRPKWGRFLNELTKFRFDVTLTVEGPPPLTHKGWLDWEEQKLTLSALRTLIASTGPELLGITGIPNGRVQQDLAVQKALSKPPPGTVARFKKELDRHPHRGVDPDQLRVLVAELGYLCELSWNSCADDGRYDLILYRKERTASLPSFPEMPLRGLAWERFASNPLQGKFTVTMIPMLRQYLQDRLPDYMIPSAFILLERFPLTANGKVDRMALPEPERSRSLEEVYLPPKSQEEQVLAGIWSEVLGIERIGVRDNFFVLGGDSIRSIQVLARAKELGLTFSLQEFFQHQTIQELARVLSRTTGESVSIRTEPFSLIGQVRRAALPEEVVDAYPLTSLQQGMLFHSQFDPQSAVYHQILSFHLKAHFDRQALEQALASLLECHPILRTGFSLKDEPLQLVYRRVAIPLLITDLTEMSQEEQEEELSQWMEEEKCAPFDWEEAPLIRFHVHLRSNESLNFSLSFHHAILDGWSVATLLSELFQQYQSLLLGEIPEKLQETAVSFRDFVALERGALTQNSREFFQAAAARVASWSLPRFPSAYRDSQKPGLGMHQVELNAELTAGLNELARQAGVPLKNVLLAAHLKVMRALANCDLVVTGVVFNGRPEELDGERVTGLFLNTLPFIFELSGGTWIELVRGVFRTERELIPHRRYPLAEIQRALGGRQLFETAFNYMNFHVYRGIMGIEGVEILGGSFFEQSNFTLIANFSPDLYSTNVQVTLSYQAGKLTPLQVSAIGTYYLETLSAMAADPLARYEMHSLLPEKERISIFGFNPEPVPFDLLPLPQCFERQVALTPERIALSFEGESITYAQLNRRANCLAHYLRDLGAGPELLVGVALERSPDLVVTLLAIMKSGAAYLPLDPGYPAARLGYMLADSAATILVTDRDVPWAEGVRVVELQREREEIGQKSAENPDPVTFPDYLAYVIYTSGSTGKPKGVEVLHRGLSNFLCSMAREPGMLQDDILLALTTVSFDIAVLELYLPLITGARILLATSQSAPDGQRLREYLDQGVTILQGTPATWRLLLAAGWAGTQGLKMLCGGEALPADLAQTLIRLGESLYNMYGPTETTVWSTVYKVEKGNREGITPIGRPIANTIVRILGQRLEPVPLGVAAELYIGGDGVARGYLNRPELTAERFLPDPFNPGGVLYRTGDLARYLPDGRIDFLGRVDNQIKVRGHRIELGEIEAVLSALSGVQDGAVRVLEQRLVAYLVVEAAPPAVSELRRQMKEFLPDYMIPSTFVFLERLPLTQNGKVDRKALPAPLAERRSEVLEPPKSEMEKRVAQGWKELLRLEHVGLHDNFFEIGGDSLMSVQFHGRSRELFGIELPVAEIYQYPTLQALAGHLARKLEWGTAQEFQQSSRVVRAANVRRARDGRISRRGISN